MKNENPDQYEFDNEFDLNRLGYALLATDKTSDAIKIFQLLVKEFPGKSNPYDSLGEAYYENGQNELAIKNYEKSLQLDKNNSHAEDMIKKIKPRK